MGTWNVPPIGRFAREKGNYHDPPRRIAEWEGPVDAHRRTYKFRPNAADLRVDMKRLRDWTPPAGFTFQGHWATADGGMLIAEVENAAAASEATAALSDLVEFHLVPVMAIMESEVLPSLWPT